MPTANESFKKLVDYEQRSQTFEPAQSEGKPRNGEWTGVTFTLGDSRLVCSAADVPEFLPIPAFTPVPGTKPWILGLANVGGNLMTVVDLAWFFYGERSQVSMRTRLLAASLRGRPIGLLVDEVLGHRQFATTEGKKPHLPAKSPLKGFVQKQYRSGNDIWQQLELDRLFTATEFLDGAAA